MNFLSKFFCLGFIVFCLFNQASGMEELQQMRPPKQLSGFLISCARVGISKDPSYLEIISNIKNSALKLVDADIKDAERQRLFSQLCGQLDYFLGYARNFFLKKFVSPLVVESLGGEGLFIEFVNSKQTTLQFLEKEFNVKCRDLIIFFGDLEYSLKPAK